MTLSTRNRLIFALGLFSTAFAALVAAGFAYRLYTGTLSAVPDGTRRFALFDSLFPFAYNKTAVYAAAATALLYVPATSFVILRYFEKTHISEVIYFTGFVACFLAEGARLIVPLFNLWEAHQTFMIVLSKIIFVCRLASSVIMISASAMFAEKSDGYSENSRAAVTALGVIVGTLIPVNSMRLLSTGFAPYAFYGVSLFVRIVFAALAALCFVITGYKNDAPEYRKFGLFFALACAGQFLLQEADNFAFALAGAALLAAGTALFLVALHKYYMWK